MTTPAPAAEAATADLGPFHTRAQAEAALYGWRSVPASPMRRRRNLETLTDAMDVLGADLGDYDLHLLGQLAGQLGPLDAEVLVSLIRRAASDVAELWMVP